MTNKGAKRNVPHLLQAQQAHICLWSISETLQCQKFHGIVIKSTVSSRYAGDLGYCPRPKGYDRGKLIEDTLAFSRRMRLKSHFTKVDLFDNTIDPDNDPGNPSQTANFNYTTDSKEKYSTFIPKSHWQPPRQGHDLETFVSGVESDIAPPQAIQTKTRQSHQKKTHCIALLTA